MTAESVLYALMSGAGPVTAIVGDRIYPVVLPEGKPLPALVLEHVSTYRPPVIDAFAGTHMTQTRMQANCLALSHTACRALADAARAAAQFQRGTIAGVLVHSVLHAGEGPTTYDAETGAFHQPIDFMVTHQQP